MEYLRGLSENNFINLNYTEITGDFLFLRALLKDALNNKKTLLNDRISGYSDNYSLVKDVFSSLDGFLFYSDNADLPSKQMWLWKDSAIDLTLSLSHDKICCRMDIYSQSQEFIKCIKDKFNFLSSEEPKPAGQVYAMIKNHDQLYLSVIGTAGIPLVEENYDPAVIENYKKITADLLSPTPTGRVVILEGAPGTGKTTMTRDLLLKVPNALFILVQPDMVANLSGPDFLPLLLQYQSHKTGPFILILEDADKCLVSRSNNKENLSMIQSLLNLGDGILGSMLDIRIIATTNAKKFEMDPAILRPGRLSGRIEIQPLNQSSEQPWKIFKKLTHPKYSDCHSKPSDWKKWFPKETISLAEIYSVARDHGWTPTKH